MLNKLNYSKSPCQYSKQVEMHKNLEKQLNHKAIDEGVKSCNLKRLFWVYVKQDGLVHLKEYTEKLYD